MRWMMSCLLMLALVVGFARPLTVQGQEGESTCSFTLMEDAAIYTDMAALNEAGLSTEQVQDIASAFRTEGLLDMEEYFQRNGYDPAFIEAFLADESNIDLLNTAVTPSPSETILNESYALLAEYGFTSGDLTTLYPLTSDYDTLYNYLLGRGLSPAQADGFTASALDIVQRARDAGVFQYAATLDGQELLDNNGYEDVSLFVLGDALDDPAALRQSLLDQGVSEEDVDGLVGDFTALNENLGLDEAYVEGWHVKTAAYTLEYYGIPSDAIVTVAGSDSESFADCLTALGFDPELLFIAEWGLDLYLFGDDELSLSLDDILEASLNDAGEFALEWGLTGADLSELSQYLDDPDALYDLLVNEYGFSPEDAELFIGSFEESIFAEVFGGFDESLAGVIDEAAAMLESGESFLLEDGDMTFILETEADDFEDFDDTDEDFDDTDDTADDVDDTDDFDDTSTDTDSSDDGSFDDTSDDGGDVGGGDAGGDGGSGDAGGGDSGGDSGGDDGGSDTDGGEDSGGEEG